MRHNAAPIFHLTLKMMFAALLIATVSQKSNADEVPGRGDDRPTLRYLAPGIKLTVVAEQPDVVTPTGIDVDALGRVWVVSSHTHFRPDDYSGPEHDEIVVLSPDGTRTVFYNRTDATMDLELGKDGWLYLAERDRILRVRDTDGDGVGDLEENIAVLETKADYPHNGLAGLAWHTNGELVFSLGENYWLDWTLTGTDGASVSGTGEGGIFRCSPDGSKLRRTAKGFWNPFGVCVRDDGEMFVAENDPGARPPCRLLHVVDGGDFGYQRLYGNAPYHPFVAWDGELRGTLPMLHAVAEAPCGVVPLGGGLLIGSWSDNRLDYYDLRREGASFAATQVPLVQSKDLFRPTCMTKADDTTFYAADWVWGTYQLHRRGRVWKIEIDPEKADWFRSRELQAETELSAQAEGLRTGELKLKTSQLLALAQDKDAYLADAAIQALAREATNWSHNDTQPISAADRVTMLLARQRAVPEDRDWAKAALADSSELVRFEALRWISAEQMNELATDVNTLLADPGNSYRVFEACLATRNTLAGNPRSGVTDVPALLETLKSKETPARIRAFALRLIPPGEKKLPTDVLQRLLQSDDNALVLEAIQTSAVRGNGELMEELEKLALDSERPTEIRAAAVAGLSGSAQRFRGVLLQLSSDEDRIVQSAALRAIRFSPPDDEGLRRLTKELEPGSKAREMAELVADPDRLKRGRPNRSDTDAWLKLIDDGGEKGDPETGRRIFYHSSVGLCAKCHRHQGRGNVVGPDLSAVAATGDRRRILKAILEPSRDVDPQYHPRMIITEDGKTFTGIMLRKGGRSGREVYRDSEGREVSFPWAEIAERRDLKTSLMPDGLVDLLTIDELRDLLAFLEEKPAANSGTTNR